MERTDEAIKLFVKKHGKTPEDAGLPVIGFYEKQHAFLYAVSKDVIKAYKTQQNIIRWQTSWYVWLLAIVLLNYGDAFFRYQDVMHWRLLATYIFLVVWCVLGIVQWVRGKKFDRLIKLGDNITFLNDGALGDNITLLDDDAEQLKADTQAFKENPFNNPDLEEFDEFDVLCLVDGKKVRLPFSKRHLGKPIGIFPFSNEPIYLELDEVENKKHTDEDVDESRLPDEPFCARVSKVVDHLNLYLQAMNKPVLEGSYLADNSSYMPACGWIIGFDNTGDYHGGSVPAKLRYMGRFEGKCQK